VLYLKKYQIKQNSSLAESSLKDPLNMLKHRGKRACTGVSLIGPPSVEKSSNVIVMRYVKEAMGQNLWLEDLESASHCKSLLADVTMTYVRSQQDRGCISSLINTWRSI